MKVKHLLHCHLLLKGVFPEMANTVSHQASLNRLLAFASGRKSTQSGADLWLCHRFGVKDQTDMPLAPFAALGEGLIPGEKYWMHADPVHFHLQRDSITLTDTVPYDLSMEESEQLIRTLNQHFSADGLQFFAPHANRWYLRLEDIPDIHTYALEDVIGQDVKRHLPQGREAIRWHQLLNELQMLLHTHPVNLERERRGTLPVNSIWPWGGGVLAPIDRTPFNVVWSEDALVRGLVRAGEGTVRPLPFSASEWLEQTDGEDGMHLLVIDQLQDADFRSDIDNWHQALAQLECHWFSPLLEFARQGRVASIHLHLAEHHKVRSFAVNSDELWKFWRRPKPLKAYFYD